MVLRGVFFRFFAFLFCLLLSSFVFARIPIVDGMSGNPLDFTQSQSIKSDQMLPVEQLHEPESKQNELLLEQEQDSSRFKGELESLALSSIALSDEQLPDSELFLQVQQLQAEIESLRDLIEKQERELTLFKKDMDRRFAISSGKYAEAAPTQKTTPSDRLIRNNVLNKRSEAQLPTANPVARPLAQKQNAFVTKMPKDLMQINAEMLDAGMSVSSTPDFPVSTSSRSLASSNPSDTMVPAATSSASDASDGKSLYDKALSLTKGHKFREAIKTFDAFVKKYPRSAYVPNAFYWLGLIYMRLDPPDFELARQSFVQSKALFSDTNPKLPDLLLKLASVYDALGDQVEARKYYSDLLARFPKSSAAKIAESTLPSLR